MPKPAKNAPASAMVRPPVIVPPDISAGFPGCGSIPRPPGAEPLRIAPPVYSFPSRVRCPHCGHLDQKNLNTVGPVRYLKCRHASCHRTFKIVGTSV